MNSYFLPLLRHLSFPSFKPLKLIGLTQFLYLQGRQVASKVWGLFMPPGEEPKATR